jgi:hypothetical protein
MFIHNGAGNWHLDKKVPISLIGTLVVQTLVFVWWAASYTASNDAVNLRQNDDIRDLKASAASFSDMKADVAVIKSNMVDIKAKFDRLK